MKNMFRSQINDKHSGHRSRSIPRAVTADSFGSGRAWRATDIAQNPARHQSVGRRTVRVGEFREGASALISYLPAIFRIFSVIVIGVILFFGYRSFVSSRLFKLQQVDITGANHVRNEEISNIVHKYTAGGVWNTNIDAVRKEIEKIPRVRSAVVARVLPSDLRVRIVERTPEVVVRSSSGQLIWVDSAGVSLDAVNPNEQMPAFFITGWDEDGSETTQAVNHDRLLIYARISDFCRSSEMATGCSERISEINLADTKDVRVGLAGEDSGVEVRLGNEKFGERLKAAIEMLDTERTTPRGHQITRLDASFDGRIIVGFSPESLRRRN